MLYTGMEYENCNSVSAVTKMAVVATMVVLLIIIYYSVRPRERMENNPDKIITALDVVMKTNGTITDFKRGLGDSSFSPTKYLHLVDMYRKNKITPASVERVMSDSSI